MPAQRGRGLAAASGAVSSPSRHGHGSRVVGSLAGAALFAGFDGQVLFFILGLALSVPLLLRLFHRFGTLLAPAAAMVAFAAIFTFSSAVVAPLPTGSDESPVTPIEQPHDDGHHPDADPR